MARFAIALAVTWTLAGCRGPESPVDCYRTFAAAARAGARTSDGGARAAATAAVWERLSARTRAELDARAQATAAAAPPGVIVASGRLLVVGDLGAGARRPASIALARVSAGEAVVTVEPEVGGPAREVTLVRERGAWRVVVPFDN